MLFASPPSFLKHPLIALKTALGFAGLPGGYAEEDINGLKKAQAIVKSGMGYMQIQGTKPQVSRSLQHNCNGVFALRTICGCLDTCGCIDR